ncbi:MAG: polysaccharide deacetylase family protein [bacterium]|nr:polysaccharide deacetylase family protein [bacterium]
MPSLLDNDAFLEYLKSRILCDVSLREKRVAITFDDGPNPNCTVRLMDLLDDKGIAATFFVVGRFVRRFPEIVTDAANRGHEIGNHTDHHIPLSILPDFVVRREIDAVGRLVREATGTQPRFLRPPMGWFNGRVLSIARGLGYVSVIGSVHPQDSKRPGTDAICERVLRRIEPGAIVILHDGGWWAGVDRNQTLEATDRITDTLLDEGYQFDTLSKLVNRNKAGVGEVGKTEVLTFERSGIVEPLLKGLLPAM